MTREPLDFDHGDGPVTDPDASRSLERHPTLTSSFCSTGGCVGVRFVGSSVEVVDTKGGPGILSFDHTEWAAFVSGVKNGEFDVD